VVEKLNLFLDLLQSYKVSLAAPRSGTENDLGHGCPKWEKPGGERGARETDGQTDTHRQRQDTSWGPQQMGEAS
jgi:hypothetical protein